MHSTRARKGGLTSSSSISALASISFFFLRMIQELNLELEILSFAEKDLRIVNFGKHISDKSIHYQGWGAEPFSSRLGSRLQSRKRADEFRLPRLGSFRDFENAKMYSA